MSKVAVINGLVLLLSAALAIVAYILGGGFWFIFWPVFVWGAATMLALVLALAVL